MMPQRGGWQMKLSFAEVQTFVSDLEVARKFYVDTLGFKLVKETEKWLILDVSGNQLILMAGGRPVDRQEAYGAECATVLCLLTRVSMWLSRTPTAIYSS
jgi:extradiol dioxygenase family protein